jgi:hypothetical protein
MTGLCSDHLHSTAQRSSFSIQTEQAQHEGLSELRVLRTRAV